MKRLGSVRRKAGEFAWKNTGMMLNAIVKKCFEDDTTLRKNEQAYLKPLILNPQIPTQRPSELI